MPKTEQPRAHSLRLPPELMRWLKHEAVDNSRSLTAEIAARLEESKTLQLKKDPADAK